MKRFFTTLCLCILCTFPMLAQDATEPDVEIETDTGEDIVYKMNQKGDQYIALKVNLDIPYRPAPELKLGGAGSLGYHHFLTDALTIGGDISFAYTTTIGDNVFYFVPFMFSIGYQFTVGKFEIPLSLGIGGAIENYIDRTYFGLAIRPEVAAYYRFNPDWSLGVHTGLYILPQWYSNAEYDYLGIIQDVGISVRYHF